MDGSGVVLRMEYDGLSRIKSHIDSQAPDKPNGVDGRRHFYYSTGWGILETRKSTSENSEPEGCKRSCPSLPKYKGPLWGRLRWGSGGNRVSPRGVTGRKREEQERLRPP